VPVVGPEELGLVDALGRIASIVDSRLLRRDIHGVLDVVDPLVLGGDLASTKWQFAH
jgi:hypothetical protein